MAYLESSKKPEKVKVIINEAIDLLVKMGIPVNYLFEENEFMWGYGKKQLRGRSTTFHTDGIKDTEFTMFKDMVADFLVLCGFPTPQGKNCYEEEEIVKEEPKTVLKDIKNSISELPSFQEFLRDRDKNS